MGRDVFTGGQDFDISMDFRTDQLNALLLFTYNTQAADYMLVRSTDPFKLLIYNFRNTQQSINLHYLFFGVYF